MKLIAHRGKDNHNYKENSKDALLWCLEKDYIDGVELDIRLTKDNQWVIYHGTSILELGFDRRFIANETLENLKKINMGTKLNPVYLDTLEEFLSSVNSDKLILLDIKCEQKDYQDELKQILRIREKYKDLHIFVCSFCYGLVKLLTTMCKTQTGLLVSDFINKKKDYKPFSFLSVSKGSFSDIHEPNKKMIWTITHPHQMRPSYKKMYIITDCAYKLTSE